MSILNTDLAPLNEMYKKPNAARFKARCEAVLIRLRLMFKEVERLRVEEGINMLKEQSQGRQPLLRLTNKKR